MTNENVQAQVRGHLRVFVGLLVLTLVGVGATLILDGAPIFLVMGIAAVQATLILTFLMHLKGEGKTVKWLLAFSGFFVAMLLALIILAATDTIDGTESLVAVPVVDEVAEGEAH